MTTNPNIANLDVFMALDTSEITSVTCITFKSGAERNRDVMNFVDEGEARNYVKDSVEAFINRGGYVDAGCFINEFRVYNRESKQTIAYIIQPVKSFTYKAKK
ncbi:hypothetical protein [Vibrio harveyi]|uniref:hypothetical protein n=1 Tax=Vibrio harveyi TaxID=669 RepID=UPI0025B22367|nr:hypothetical protein [Vibrio harveyi]WJT09259.1 hypothetical protein PH545_24850 [Vibrio harveyi]